MQQKKKFSVHQTWHHLWDWSSVVWTHDTEEFNEEGEEVDWWWWCTWQIRMANHTKGLISALYLNLFPKCRHGHFLLFFCGLHFMSRSFSSPGLRRRTIRDTESPYFRGRARSSDWFRHRSDSVCLHPTEHHVPLPWGGGHVPELRPQILYRGPQKRHEPEKSKRASCLLTTFCTFLTISCLF